MVNFLHIPFLTKNCKMNLINPALVSCFIFFFSFTLSIQAQITDPDLKERFRKLSERSEKKGLAETFKGITTNGQVTPELFKIHSTGVKTEPIRKAADQFIKSIATKYNKVFG